MGRGPGQSPKLEGSVMCSCPNAELCCEAAVGAAPHNQDKLSRVPPHYLPCSCTAEPSHPTWCPWGAAFPWAHLEAAVWGRAQSGGRR